MGNTPRSRSKFSFKEKDRLHKVARRKTGVSAHHDEVAYVFFFPLAEINFKRGHGELLADPPLIVHGFRDQ